MHVMIRVMGEEQKDVKFRLWAESPQKLGRLADELTSMLGFFGEAEQLSVSCQSKLEIEGRMKLSSASWSTKPANVVGEVISRLLCAFGWKEDRHIIARNCVTIELEQHA